MKVEGGGVGVGQHLPTQEVDVHGHTLAPRLLGSPYGGILSLQLLPLLPDTIRG